MRPFDLQAHLREFARWHQDRRNRACHYAGIPLVTLAVLGWLSAVRLHVSIPWLGELDLALILLAATFFFDLWLAWQLAPAVLFLGLVSWWIARQLPGLALAVVFAVGWVFQLVGHRLLEKNAPAFTDNLLHLVVGPRWLVNRILRLFPEEQQ